MDINVMSKSMFDSLMKTNNINDETVEQWNNTVFFISISDTDKFSDSRIPHFKRNHKNVLNLSFDDCERDGEPSPTQPMGTKAFTEEQAIDLLEFIDRNLDKKQCIVHCMAGLSRSPAVALFINDLVGNSYKEFKRNHPHICPNAHVTRLLNNALRYKSNL